MPEIDNLPAMVTTVALATFLGLSVPTLNRWRGNGEGPRWVKVGTAVRYPRESIREWLTAHESQLAPEVA